MKKSFTLFSVSALFLMLLFPVSVKADPIVLSFIFENPNGSPDEDCNGNTITDWDAITTSDFHFSSKLYNDVKKQSSYLGKSWTSFKAGAKACTRHDVHLEAGSYTFTLKTTWMYGNNNTRVPIIRVNSTDYSLNNVNYPSNEEVDLEYTVSIPSTNDYPILITCVDGEVDKFCMRTLTITKNCTQHTVTVAADDNDKGTVAGGGSYCENSDVTVTATPKPGYNFVNWTDNNNSNEEVSTNASYTFTLTANVNYRANFAACEGAAVTVNVNNGDMGAVTGGGSYCAGSQVNLTATPNSGYRFVKWTVTSGVATLDDARSKTTHFVMSDPATAVTIRANFEEDIKEDRTYTYRAVEAEHNTDTEKSTDEYLYLTNGAHYIDFTHYSATATTCTIKVGYYSDNSRKEYKITVNGGQEKTGDTPDDGDGESDMGGFTLSEGDNIIKIRSDWNWFGIRYIKVIVEESKYVVTVVNDDTYGTVTAAPSNFAGEVVNISVDANLGNFFSGWASDDVTFTNALETSTTFEMPAHSVTITANYTTCTQHTVTLAANNNEYGSVSGGGLQCDGSVTVTATPNSDYRFVNWTDNNKSNTVVSTDAAYTLDLSADISLTANFELDPCSSSLTIEVEGNYAASEDYSGVNYPNDMIFVERDPSGSKYVSSCHGSGYVNFQGSSGGKEILIPVNIPVIGSYKVKAYAGQNKDMYINIYATTATDQGSITYKSTTYYKQKYKQINESNDSETFVESEYTDAVELPTGVCLIGLYSGWSHSVWDQITITRTDGKAFCPNTITMQKNGDASAAAPTSSPASAAMAGTKVTITAGEASANHYFINWTATPAVTFENTTDLSTTFVMPAEDVTITANYGAVVLSALNFAAGEGGSVSATAGGNAINSGAEVNSGTFVTLTAEANSNYVFINWTDNNNDEVVSTNAAFTFSMPATATSYTANFAQIDNVIITGSETTVTGESGEATLTVTSVSDFNAFNHNVLKFAYSDMNGKHKGQKVAFDEGYSYASSAGATGFGFYYKTEKADDHVAFCFDTRNGQVKWQLAATNNVWKYVYIPHSEANSWNHGGIIIYMNGSDKGNYDTWSEQTTTTAYPNGGAFYMSEIAATSITSKPEINSYTYTRANNSNSYGTLCLPMNGSVSGATLYSIAGKQEEGGMIYIVLEEQGATLAAGEPYIFETDGSTLTATMSGPHSPVNAEAKGLVGTYQQITAPAYSESTDNLNYVLALDNSNNTVFKRVGENVTVDAYRAYINIKNAGDYSPASAAPGRKYIRFGIEGTEEEQAVEMIYDDASLRTRKIMQNGHLYILRDGHLFTAQGTRIK